MLLRGGAGEEVGRARRPAGEAATGTRKGAGPRGHAGWGDYVEMGWGCWRPGWGRKGKGGLLCCFSILLFYVPFLFPTTSNRIPY
jgi:hypothetical protein